MRAGDWCTVREAAARLNIDRDSIYDLIHVGKLRSITVYAPNKRSWQAVWVPKETDR